MRRSLPPLVVLILALLGVAVVVLASTNPRPAAASARIEPSRSLPATTCNFTPLTFNLSGTGPIEATRAFSVTAGDTFEQFILPPITTTVTSTLLFSLCWTADPLLEIPRNL